MRIERFIVGMVGTNCYVVSNEETLECFLIDPGAYSDKMITYIRENALKPRAILLTHGHFDHIMGIDKVIDRYGEIRCVSYKRRTGFGACRDENPCDPYAGAYDRRMLLLYRIGKCVVQRRYIVP